MVRNAEVKQEPATNGGKELWRGLEEWSGTPEFQEMLHREFPEDAESWTDPVTRRTFLTLAGATAALAGFGCSPRPASPEKIYPYVVQPEDVIPGIPLFFATGFALGGITVGLLGESREGRPIKIEGNPSHPGSLGGTSPIAQATLLDLYDPDRSKAILNRGVPAAWDSFVSHIRSAFERYKQTGKSVRILTETVGSPTLGALLDDLVKTYPNAKWVQYEPANRDNSLEGARLAFGEYVNTYYDFSKALRVVSLDSDFLTSGASAVRYARDFAVLRVTHTKEGDRIPTPEELNRLYVIESMLTPTGAVADHRFPMRSVDVEAFARALAKELGVDAGDAPAPTGTVKWVSAIAKDLQQHRGRSAVVVGEHQPPAVHAVAHAINAALGNVGTTVFHTAPIEVRPANQTKEIKELVDEMNAGSVAGLLILGANPVFSAPADIDFKSALAKVEFKAHLGLYLDETAVLCDWHVNEAHYLETWGDGVAYDGTASLAQPLIAPLYSGRTAMEVVSVLLPETVELYPRDIVKNYWRKNWPANGGSKGNFDSAWQAALRLGVIQGTARAAIQKQAAPANIPAYKAPAAGIEVNFRPDPTIYDGRFINNAWLQELPKPVTKLTWDNAIIVSPKTAARFDPRIEATGGGSHGRAVAQVAELAINGRTVRAAVWVQPGHADDSITLHFGYGRDLVSGRVGSKTGFNFYTVRTSTNAWLAVGADLKDTGEEYILACTQAHHSMEGRRPARGMSIQEYALNYAAWKEGKAALYAQVPPVAAPHWKEINELLPSNQVKHGHSHAPGHNGKSEGDKKKEEKHEHHDSRLVPLTLYPDVYEGEKVARWAMAIDLTKCVGCNACVAACVAENNIPSVGKKEVTRGREMHWIRVDRYYEGSPDDAVNLTAHFQPVPCMQCEKAPCEVVCPVVATAHSFDGLNDMIYNRCVGTRYCSNNCPYKVRRFNFLTYTDWKTPSLKLMRNPEVTVRERGVMEKCTYCVQRIRAAEIEAERQGRRVRDGEILTACQQACPADAIVFGDLSDAKSRVNVWKAQPSNYGLLAELNTMPRTTYLAAIRNPNPELARA